MVTLVQLMSLFDFLLHEKSTLDNYQLVSEVNFGTTKRGKKGTKRVKIEFVSYKTIKNISIIAFLQNMDSPVSL